MLFFYSGKWLKWTLFLIVRTASIWGEQVINSQRSANFPCVSGPCCTLCSWSSLKSDLFLWLWAVKWMKQMLLFGCHCEWTLQSVFAKESKSAHQNPRNVPAHADCLYQNVRECHGHFLGEVCSPDKERWVWKSSQELILLGWGESCANKSVLPLVCPYLHIFILKKIPVYLILLNIWDDSSLKCWSWGFKCLVNALCWHLQLMPLCVGVQNWLLLVYVYLWPSDIILQVATRPEFIFVCV